jgi:hypothetical protein
MADLQCAVRNHGCKGTAKFVCHHCGKPICSQCDKEMLDDQFASLSWHKFPPKAHHCPKCSHSSTNGKLIFGTTKLRIRKYLRKFSF